MNNPWRGLASYKDPLYSKASYMFCGRDTEIAEVTKYIDNNLFVTLYGRTGIGKTSLLNAGVFPLLRMRNYNPIYIRLSQKPKDYTYAQYVIEEIEGSDLKTLHATIDNSALNNDSAFLLWNYFFTTKFYNEQNIEVYPVIVLDQFEEIFMMQKNESLLLLTQISTLLSDNYDVPEISGCSYETNYRFVASIREDNLYCLEDAIDELGLACLKENRYRLRPLSQANAKSVVLQPGCNCLRSGEADDIAEKAVELSKDNDGSVSSLILSLICSIMFERAKQQNQSTPMIKAAMLPANQKDTDEILCDFYLHHTTKKQRKVIQEELLTSDGHRKCSNVSIPNEEDLLSNETRILHKLETNEGAQTEIVHDRMAKVIYMNRRKQDSHKFRSLLRTTVLLALILILGIAILLSWTSSNNNEYKLITAVNTNRWVKANVERVLKIESDTALCSVSSEVDTIYLGKDVANIDSLLENTNLSERHHISFNVSPENKVFGWNTLWRRYWGECGEVGYLYKKESPSVILYSNSLLGVDAYPNYRLPLGIDELEYDSYKITHDASLPRYGVKSAIIDSKILPEYFKGDNMIEEIVVTEPIEIDATFSHNDNIRKVVFTTDSASIQSKAFAYCQNLKEVSLPKVLTGYGGEMFLGCLNLSQITMPKKISHIDCDIFKFCPNIRKINIPKESEFHFDEDSILYHKEEPLYFNLYTKKERFKSDAVTSFPDTTYIFFRGHIIHNETDLNIINNKSNPWLKKEENFSIWKGNVYYKRINWINDGRIIEVTDRPIEIPNIISLDRRNSSIHLPVGKSAKYIILGDIASLKEVHTPVADPLDFELDLGGDDYKQNITLYIPYGCKDRYELSKKFENFNRIEEDACSVRIKQTIMLYAQNAGEVFGARPLIFYGLSLVGLLVLYILFYQTRRKQMINNGKFNKIQCIGAGILGDIAAVGGFIPMYYIFYIILSNHVNPISSEPCRIAIGATFGVISASICSYLFVFAGKGKIWNKFDRMRKNGL